MMRRILCAVVALVALMAMGPAAAWAVCDVTYRVQQGDTLFSIAEVHYADQEQWTLIYYANQGVLNGGAQVSAGQDIFIPCQAAGLDPAAEVAALPDVALPPRAELTLLTGGNYAPFADRTWDQEGMVTELVTAALAATPSPVSYELVWENDWSRHLFPMLDQQRFDMGFPWVRPDCEVSPEEETCQRFHFSEPLMDLPIMLFKRQGSSFEYESDADIAGARLCRPAGHSIYDLERPGREWVSGGVVTLIQHESAELCFEDLMAGRIDAVSVDVFQGATKIVAMGLRGRAVPIDTPLSKEQLHVVISKTHWRGTTHLHRLNTGLAVLRESGAYDEIVERHLQIFWSQLQ